MLLVSPPAHEGTLVKNSVRGDDSCVVLRVRLLMLKIDTHSALKDTQWTATCVEGSVLKTKPWCTACVESCNILALNTCVKSSFTRWRRQLRGVESWIGECILGMH